MEPERAHGNGVTGVTGAGDGPNVWFCDFCGPCQREVFNLANTQNFKDVDYSRSGWGKAATQTAPASNFSNWTTIQGSPRVMRFGLHYAF